MYKTENSFFPLLGALFYYCPSLFIQKLLNSKVVQYVLENITIQNSSREYYWKSRRERVFHVFLSFPPHPIPTQLPLNTSNRDPQIECNFRRRFSGIFKLLQFFIPKLDARNFETSRRKWRNIRLVYH